MNCQKMMRTMCLKISLVSHTRHSDCQQPTQQPEVATSVFRPLQTTSTRTAPLTSTGRQTKWITGVPMPTAESGLQGECLLEEATRAAENLPRLTRAPVQHSGRSWTCTETKAIAFRQEAQPKRKQSRSSQTLNLG